MIFLCTCYHVSKTEEFLITDIVRCSLVPRLHPYIDLQYSVQFIILEKRIL